MSITAVVESVRAASAVDVPRGEVRVDLVVWQLANNSTEEANKEAQRASITTF
jgi:hypothetical protein